MGDPNPKPSDPESGDSPAPLKLRSEGWGSTAFAPQVDLTARVATLGRRAGIPCASVVSASAANANVWTDPWEAVHPLLYMQTMGRKEAAMAQAIRIE